MRNGMAKKNEGNITATISTGLIAILTYTSFVPDEFQEFSKLAVPFLSHWIVIFCVWIFLISNFDTIDNLRESKARLKLRKEIQQDIDALNEAIDSGRLNEVDTEKKRKELDMKYKELTNIKVKV